MNICDVVRMRRMALLSAGCLVCGSVVLLVTSCSTLASTESDAVTSSTVTTASGPVTLGVIPSSATLLPEGKSLSLDEGRQLVDERIIIPGDAVTGGAVTVVVCGESSGDVQSDVKYEGIAIEFACGAVLKAAPLLEGQPIPDYKELQATEEAAGITFTDGREHPFEVLEVNGRQTLVQAAGAQSFPNSDTKSVTNPLPALVMWYDNGILYKLASDTQAVEELVVIAKSMK